MNILLLSLCNGLAGRKGSMNIPSPLTAPASKPGNMEFRPHVCYAYICRDRQKQEFSALHEGNWEIDDSKSYFLSAMYVPDM